MFVVRSGVCVTLVVALLVSFCSDALGQETGEPERTQSPATVEQKEPRSSTDRTAGASSPGEWELWSSWSGCSRTCGSGVRERSRRCKRGVCVTGDISETRTCILRHCEPGSSSSSSVGNWSPWSVCPVSCGGGQSRRRRCQTSTCANHDDEMRLCNEQQCPQLQQQSNVWALWANWGSCSRDCISRRRRTCQSGTNRCSGSAEGRRRCDDPPCVRSWGTWSPWTPCSATCSGTRGRRRRSRTCPGGAQCSGSGDQEETCAVLTTCAYWTQWSSWSVCSGSCDSVGSRTRVRACRGSENGGRCVGNTVDSQSCSVPSCGSPTWGAWSVWDGCSKTCGGGESFRTRTCRNGQCQGSNGDRQACNSNACPAAPTPRIGDSGRWQVWGLWSSCSVSCGSGNSFRSRDCGQGTCSGHAREILTCDMIACEGSEWATWSSWATCSISCGWGNTIRERACLGEHCVGSVREVQQCAVRACPGVPLPTTESPPGTGSPDAQGNKSGRSGAGNLAGTLLLVCTGLLATLVLL